jgi:hypothetical protein
MFVSSTNVCCHAPSASSNPASAIAVIDGNTETLLPGVPAILFGTGIERASITPWGMDSRMFTENRKGLDAVRS